MKRVINVENRKQFINEMIEQSKVDKDYLVITTNKERIEHLFKGVK